MFQRILVPYDGSECARQAVPVAARLARASGGSVLLLRVTSPLAEGVWPVDPSLLINQEVWQAERQRATAELEALAASEDLEGITVTTSVVEQEGSTAEMILATARSWHADLIVLCSHGRTGLMRWILGSVAHKIALHSPVPVLLLRAQGQGLPVQGEHPIRILVGLDGSPLAETALAPAAALSAALSAPAPGELSLVRVLPLSPTYDDPRSEKAVMQQETEEAQTYLQEVEQTLTEQTRIQLPFQITSMLIRSLDIAETLLRVAASDEEEDVFEQPGPCDLIALATHGRSGLAHWVMGSVTERVLHATRLPLLIIRPPQSSQPHPREKEKVLQN